MGAFPDLHDSALPRSALPRNVATTKEVNLMEQNLRMSFFKTKFQFAGVADLTFIVAFSGFRCVCTKIKTNE